MVVGITHYLVTTCAGLLPTWMTSRCGAEYATANEGQSEVGYQGSSLVHADVAYVPRTLVPPYGVMRGVHPHSYTTVHTGSAYYPTVCTHSCMVCASECCIYPIGTG